MAKQEKLVDVATRAVKDFTPTPYAEVDKALREGAQEAIEFYKESVTETLRTLEAHGA